MRPILLILFFTGHALTAQHTSELGRFSIEYPKGCTPVTIHVSELDNLGNISRQYLYEDGLIETTDTTHTYNSPGTYTIIQYLGVDIQPKSDTLIFEVFDALPPEYEVLQCSSTGVMISINDDYYDYYQVKFSNTDSIIYQHGDPDPTYDYGQSSGTVQVVGHFNDSFSNCGDQTTSFNLPDQPSVTIDEVELTEGCSASYYLSVSFSSISAYSIYEIQLKQGLQEYETIYTGTISNSIMTFPVIFDVRQPEYCVNIQINNPCSASTEAQQEICETSRIRVQDLAGSYASYSGNRILIHLDSSSSGMVEIHRKSGRSETFGYLTETSADYLDPIPSLSRPFDYLLLRKDTCGHVEDSIMVNAPFIRLIDKDEKENRIYLDEEAPANALGAAVKSVIIYNADSSEVTEMGLVSGTLQLPPGYGSVIRIRTQYSYESAIIYSNELSVTYEYRIHVPNAFTPNGDGLNDQLELFGLPTEAFRILIFDRWGKVIHTATENPVWDGKKGRDLLEEGTYTYQLRFTLENGELKTQVGTFTIIKN